MLTAVSNETGGSELAYFLIAVHVWGVEVIHTLVTWPLDSIPLPKSYAGVAELLQRSALHSHPGVPLCVQSPI